MKKLLALFIALIMLFCMVACSSTPDDEPITPNKDNVEDTEKKDQTDDAQENNDEETPKQEEDQVFQVPKREIYYSIPSEMTIYQNSRYHIFSSNSDYFVGICYEKYKDYDGAIEDIVSKYALFFLTDVGTSCQGAINKNSLEVIDGENVKIAGLDAYKFTATVENSNWDCYAYGYTYVVDNVPLMVIGLVHSHEQADQMIKDVTKYTDQIAASVRTEK